MAEQSSDQYVGFLVPFQASTDDVWDDESSYQQDGPKPGGITPAAGSRLRLQATGEQDGTSYVLTTRRGGHIGSGGAGFSWRKSTDSAGTDRGFDPPTLIHMYQPISYTSAAVGSRSHPDRVVLPDGSVLVCASVQLSASHAVRTFTIAADGTVGSAVGVYSQTATPSARVSAHLCPSMALLDDGSVILGHLIEDTTQQEAQWRVYRSTDSGATWTEISTEALPEPISTDTSTSGDGLQIKRCRMRHNRGYTLLVVEEVRYNTGGTDRYAYHQFASTADGTQFELVEEMSERTLGAGNAIAFGVFDAWTFEGGFVVLTPTTVSNLRTYKLPDAYAPISGASRYDHTSAETLVTVASGNYYSDGHTSIWTAPDGTVYIAWRAVASSSKCRIARSTADLTSTASPFETMGDLGSAGGSWWRASDLGTYPAQFVGCSAYGRSNIFAVVEASTTTTYEGSLFHLGLGGWSNVTFPGQSELAPESRRASWTHTGIPVELPGNTVWTKTASGTNTVDMAGGTLQADASASTLYWSDAPTCALDETLIFEFSATITAGGVIATTSMIAGARVVVDDGAEGYETQVRLGISPNRIAIYDPNHPTTTLLATQGGLDWSNVYEIRVEQNGSSSQVWYRIQDNASDRSWTLIHSETALTDNAGAVGANLIRWGPAHISATIESDWNSWHYLDGDENAARAQPFTNPDDLFTPDYAGVGRAVYVEGMLVSALGGPGRQGESFTLAPIYDPQKGAIDNALYNISTPRRKWRTPPIDPVTGNITEQTIAYQTGPGSEESYPLSEIVGVHVAGATWCTGVIQRKDTSSGWVNVSTFDLCAQTGFTGTRYGNTVRPTSGSSGYWVDRDELRGGWLRIGASAPYTWRKVASNTPGLLAAPSSGLAVTLQLEGVDGTETSSAVAMAIIPPEVTVLVHTAGETAEGWRVKIPTQNCAEGTAEAGCLWLGYVVVPGKRWELGSRTATTSGTSREGGYDRSTYARELAPDRRELEIGWTALNPTMNLQGSTADPNYALGSALSGARPINAPDAAPGDVVGLVRRCRGSLVPVVALPQVLQLTGSTARQIIWKRDQQIRGYFDGPVSVRHVTGDEGSATDGLSYRVEAVPFTEIV